MDRVPAQLAGAINETARVGQRNRALANRLLALYGVERYNGAAYLLKWPPAALDDLALDLERQAQLVRETAARARGRDACLALYRPPSSGPEDVNFTDGSFWGAPEALLSQELLAALASTSPLGKLSRLVVEESPFVYSFPLLAPATCEALVRRVEHYAEWEAGQPADVRNAAGFNRRHAPLKNAGLDALSDALLNRVVQPLARLLFPQVAGGATDAAVGKYGVKVHAEAKSALDFHYAYVVGYGDEETVAKTLADDASRSLLARTKLVPHTDDSEVTLNVCLGRDFSGGELVLRGLRNTEAEGTAETKLKPAPGRAILHLGQHLHEVEPVTAGQRFSLILWARNSQYRSGICPCCLVHRRTMSCICDATWN